jgi:haloalkane dehalogenase
MTDPGMPGTALSRAALEFWARWDGPVFMAVGTRDPVLGPPVMDALRSAFPGCPPPLLLDDAGHFVQEHGDTVAHAAIAAFTGRAAT